MKHKHTTIHVFISSPGDCLEERKLLRDIVRKVSESEDARNQGIELQPLLWEDLPPGEALPGDLQSRVDDLLDRYGLNHYEIYIGMMKGRIGSATPAFRSGTVEEFETATSRKKKTNLPSEILFYFIDNKQSGRPQEVVDFEKELAQRGFLFSSIESAKDLELNTYTHLIRIVQEWFYWRNRIKRQLRSLKTAAAIVLSITVLVVGGLYLKFDRGAAVHITQILHQEGPRAAAKAWEQESPYIFLHGPTVKTRINQAFFSQIANERDLVKSLEEFRFWNSSSVQIKSFADQARNQIVPQLTHEIQAKLALLNDSPSLILWEKAAGAEIWNFDSPEGRPLLGLIAAQALFDALVREQRDPFQWQTGFLRSFEMDAVKNLCLKIKSNPKMFHTWGTRRHRIAAAATTSDWSYLQEAATLALQHYDENDPPEIKALVLHAPEAEVKKWLNHNITSSLKTYVFARIVEAVAQRRTCSLGLALIELMEQGKAPVDSLDPQDFTFLSEISDCGAQASNSVSSLFNDKNIPGASTLEILLSASDTSFFTEPQRSVITGRLMKVMKEDKKYESIFPQAYLFLANLKVPSAFDYLRQETDEYLKGNISYGAKASLIQILPLIYPQDAEKKALELAEKAHREAAAFKSKSIFTDRPVQAAYLRIITASGRADWKQHKDHIVKIFSLRSQQESTDDFDTQFDQAANLFLKKLSPSQMLDLFEFPPGIVSDELGEKWEKRLYLLNRLAESKIPLPGPLTDQLLVHLPVGAELRDTVLTAVARLGGSAGWEFFRKEYQSGNRKAVRYLGQSGDVKAIKDLLSRWNPSSSRNLLEEILAAAEWLPMPSYREIITAAVSSFHSSVPELLWQHAMEVEIKEEKLTEAAIDRLKNAKGVPEAVLALRYLVHVQGKDVWNLLLEPDLLNDLSEILNNADPFDWVTLVQELPLPENQRIDHDFKRVAGGRKMLTVLSENQVAVKDRLPLSYLQIGNSVISNRLFAIFSKGNGTDAALWLLDFAQDGTKNIETLGHLTDEESAFRSYCLWVASETLAQYRVPPSTILAKYDLLRALKDKNANVRRAAASVCIAAFREE